MIRTVLIKPTADNRKLPSKWSGHFTLSGPLTLYHKDYFTGVDEDPTMFDARCTRFLGVNYDDLVERTLRGGSDEEILEWCFEHGRRPSEEEIAIWNAFLSKRGWRDDASADLQAAKERSGFGDREDIQTWIDLHDAEEGRTPATLFSH